MVLPMKDNIIDFLNSPMDICVIICVVAAWFAVWHLLLKKLLKRCNVTSFWYELYKFGAFGTLGIIVFLLLLATLFIGSIQTAIDYGIKMLFPICIFCGGFVAIAILIIRSIRKKK